MNISLQTLLEPSYVPAANAAIFTNTTGQSVLLQKVTFTNNSNAAVTLSLNWVPSGGAAGAANLIVNATSVSPKGPTNDGIYECIGLEGHILAPGDSLWAVAGTADTLVAAISGSLIS
jgi:hypothetical protein